MTSAVDSSSNSAKDSTILSIFSPSVTSYGDFLLQNKFFLLLQNGSKFELQGK